MFALRHERFLGVSVLLSALLLAGMPASAAAAQPPAPTPQSPAGQPAAQDEPATREAGHQALREGRFSDALTHFQAAADIDDSEPSIWLEIGDAADRLRLNNLALEAYLTYLRLVPDALDGPEVLARVRVLVQVSRSNGGAVDSRSLLVGWSGYPRSSNAESARVGTAAWDGWLYRSGVSAHMHASPGRRLSAP